MSLFVDLRQIKTSVTNLSEMVDKISTSVGKDKIREDLPRKENSVLFDDRVPYKPSTLGFGVRFSQSQEDVYKNMPSSRLRSHMSLPNLGKPGGVFDKCNMAPEQGPRIVELDDRDNESTAKSTIQSLTDNINDWILASTHKRPHFEDNGETHPMDFLENVKYYMSELNIPEEKQLSFIMSCLDGVPLMWARCFKSELKDTESFFRAFEDEFWGADRQKAALYDMKLGKYDDGNQMSMSEYFLHKVSNYRHLNPPPSDLEVVYSLAAHYPSAVELELRLAPQPTLRDAYRLLRRRERDAPDFLPNYLFEMCEAFQRGQRPESARRHDTSRSTQCSDKDYNKEHQ